MKGPGEAGTTELNRFSGRLLRTVFQGESVLHEIALEDGAIVTSRALSQGKEECPRPGEEVTVALHPADTLIVPEQAR